MNEEIQNVEVVEDDEKVTAEPEQTSEKPQDEKKYTDAEVDAIINRKFAKWSKEQEEKKSEAEKLANMNAKEKAEYEAKKQADRIADLEAQLKRKDMEATAVNLLAEKGITATADVINFVVRDDAEQTHEAINTFAALVNDLADKKVSEMLKGTTPKKVEQTMTGVITKEDFNKMGYKDRNELLNSNPELYKQLKGS